MSGRWLVGGSNIDEKHSTNGAELAVNGLATSSMLESQIRFRRTTAFEVPGMARLPVRPRMRHILY